MALNSTPTKVSEIAILLMEGKKRQEIIQIVGKKYNIKKAIIDRYIRQAKPIAEEKQKGIVKKVEERTEQLIIEKDIQSVFPFLERLELLAEIAKKRTTTTQLLLPKDEEQPDGTTVRKFIPVKAFTQDLTRDCVKAIELYSKLVGDAAPDKLEVKQKIVITGLRVI